MSVLKEEWYTDFSFETFDSAYHALERFDSLLWILAGVVSIICKVVRDRLYDPKFTLYILLSGTEDLAVVLIWNLRGVQRQVQKTGMRPRPTLANGCSNIKRPSRVGLLVVVVINSERREERGLLTW
jgi:hypothetical protein